MMPETTQPDIAVTGRHELGHEQSIEQEKMKTDLRTTDEKSTTIQPSSQDESARETPNDAAGNLDLRNDVSSNEISSSSNNNLSIELPRLPYDLRDHKLSIAIYWTAITAECCFIPISFYYGLSNGTDLRAGAMFAIITAVFGFVTGFEYAMRGWRLVQKSDKYRPLNGSTRLGFDAVHWVLMGPYFVMTAVMIGVSIPDPPKTRGLSIILPIGMIMVGFMMVGTGIANACGWRLKYFRMSSHTKGSICPPLTFCILEDMVSVDGRGGKVYREAAMARYNASPRFRTLLVQLLWTWALSAIGLGAAMIAIVFSIPAEIAYGLGWGIPTLWGALGAVSTIYWCKRSVRIERELWNSEKGVTAA